MNGFARIYWPNSRNESLLLNRCYSRKYHHLLLCGILRSLLGNGHNSYHEWHFENSFATVVALKTASSIQFQELDIDCHQAF